MLAPWKESYDKPKQRIKKKRHYFANRGPYDRSYGFSSSHVQIWELDHKEGWVPKNWFIWTVELEKTLESPLDCKEIKPVNPKGDHWKNWSWSSNTLHTWHKEPTHWKRPWCWERLRAGGEGDDRGWDCWMALLTQWTWVWENFRRQWRTGVKCSRRTKRTKGEEIKWSCLGFRDKAEQASDFASSLPGHYPDCEWLPAVSARLAALQIRWGRILRLWRPWRGPGQPSPRHNNTPSFTRQNKQH